MKPSPRIREKTTKTAGNKGRVAEFGQHGQHGHVHGCARWDANVASHGKGHAMWPDNNYPSMCLHHAKHGLKNAPSLLEMEEI